MRSYPIKSRALFNNLSRVEGSFSQIMKNSVAFSACSFIRVKCAKLVPKLFFFMSGFYLSYFAMPISSPEREIFVF
jgi:hypothetical protein